MEERIRSIIYSIFRKYGSDKRSDTQFRIERILTLCMNDIACHPGLEPELDTEEKTRYFIMQTILDDISVARIKRL